MTKFMIKKERIMYILTSEDKKILENYRAFLKEEVFKSESQEVKMVLGKSVELLSGDITSETLANYLEVQVKKGPKSQMALSDDTQAKMKEIMVVASKYGVMDVVKRFKQGS